MFSVCAVIYGDHLPLAQKLLESLRFNAHVEDFRLGLNAVSPATYDYVHRWAAEQCHSQPVTLFEPAEGQNVGKYPLMRQMLNYRDIADRVMWFDDDSYLDSAAGLSWWDQANKYSKQAFQVGAIHSIMQRGRQYEVIKKQPWFRGKPINQRHRFRFITGGWWIAHTELLKKWNYPFPALYHNGGDSILGEVARQQNQKLLALPGGMQCHCESCSKKGIKYGQPVVHINVGGRKGRRGIGVKDEKYIWADGDPNPSLDHQNFDLKVFRYAV